MPLAAKHESAIRALDKPTLKSWLTLINAAFAMRKPPTTSEALIKLCNAPAGLHPKDLASPLFTKADPLAVAILENLMGHGITRAPTPQERQAMVKARKSKKRSVPITISKPGITKRDMIVRMVVPVNENPHHPSAGVFQRYMHYRDGETVDQVVARGVRMEDIGFHVAKGCIKLEEPA